MLNNIRNFAKTKYAVILVGILIVPFVLWGMGGAFSGGNQNNIAKINNENVSTKDFQDHLSVSNVDVEKIRKNIDNNIIEEILSELISIKMLNMEVKDANFIISNKVLNKKIKKNKNFLDENNKFSRIKYEKFLLSSNISAANFESRIRNNELKNNLFKYISGGLSSPLFLVNERFKEDTKDITVEYTNLFSSYKKKEDFTDLEIDKFVEENQDIFKEKLISFKYSKITPKNLIGISEFNNLFFEKIDDLENELTNSTSFENIKSKYNLESNFIENYKIDDVIDKKKFYTKIFQDGVVNELTLLEENDFFILYEITKSDNSLPDTNTSIFKNKVKEMLFNKTKYEFNNKLISEISEKKFNQTNFQEIAKNNLAIAKINSIDDKQIFTKDSIKYLLTRSKNDFSLVADEEKNVYLVKIIEIFYKDISKNSEDFTFYKNRVNTTITNSIYDTYDLYINDKYKVKVNVKTLERVKNYFR